jgi:tetratricopeptide (TPR) repeat protein
LAAGDAAAGPPEEAVQLFDQAARLLEAQWRRDPSDRTTAWLLANDYWFLSDCHRQAGRPAEALRSSQAAIEVLSGLADRWPAHPTARLNVLIGRTNLAGLQRQCGDPDASRLVARQVADDFERFCADSSSNLNALVVATNDGTLAPALRHAGAPEESLRVARCCLRIAEQLVRTYPDDPRHRVGLSDAWMQLGKTHWGERRHAEAEAALRAAAAAAGELAERWPEYRPLFQERRSRLGRFLVERGRKDEAAALLPAIR